MRNRFDRQLEQLHEELVEMGRLCQQAISSAMEAVTQGDSVLARQAMEADSRVDQYEREIEGLCLKLLLQQQPVAKDLREISSALKMISDMERIGDQATDIAEIAGYITPYHIRSHEMLSSMAEAAISMVDRAVDSFVSRDETAARKVIADDDVVDGLFVSVKRQLIDCIGAEPDRGEYFLDLLMIAKYLERIGDHATNIAEWVIFSIEGRHDN